MAPIRHRAPLRRRVPGARAVAAAGALGFVAWSAWGPAPLAVPSAGAQVTTTTARSSTSKPATTTTTARTSSTAPATTVRPAVPTTSVATTAAPTTAPPTTAAPTTAAPTTTAVPAPATTAVVPPANAPFPASLVAPVAPPASTTDVAPELDVAAIYQAASEDPGTPDIVVQFRAPFALPNASYEVSVVVGDPDGARVSASLRSTNPTQTPSGVVRTVGETGTTTGTTGTTTGSTAPGAAGTAAGTAPANPGETNALFDPSGFVVIGVPLASAPPGGALWVEINEGAMSSPTVRSPFYSRDALLGSAPAGLLPSGAIANVARADGRTTTDAVDLPTGPVLAAADGLVQLSYTEPVPTELLGQPVTEATDLLQIARSYDGMAATTDFVAVDHLAGTVTLFDGSTPLPADRSGDRSWIVGGSTTGGTAAGGSTTAAPASTPATLTIDLDGVAQALGTEPPSNRTGLGVMRRFVLADGRTVVADAVLGTSEWFDLVPASAKPTVPGTAPATVAPTAAGGEDRSGLWIVLVSIVCAVVPLLLVLLVFVVRQRRRAAHEADEAAPTTGEVRTGAVAGDDRVPWGRADDASLTARATAEIERIKLETGSVPVVDPTVPPPTTPDAAPPADAPADTPAEAPEAAVVVTDTVGAATTGPAPTDSPAAAETGPTPALDPTSFLASLDADLDALRSRLGSHGAREEAGQGPEGAPPADDAPS